MFCLFNQAGTTFIRLKVNKRGLLSHTKQKNKTHLEESLDVKLMVIKMISKFSCGKLESEYIFHSLNA